MNNKTRLTLLLLLIFSVLTGILKARDAKPETSAEDLAKKLSNPATALILVFVLQSLLFFRNKRYTILL